LKAYYSNILLQALKQLISMESEASEYVNAGDLTRMPLIKAGNGFTKRKLPSSPGTTLLDSTFVGLEPLDQIV
jgi:hypothetical protein